MDSLVALGAGASLIYSVVMTYNINNNSHSVHNLYFESVAVVITLVMLGKYFERRSKSKKYKTLNEDDILREIILKEFKKYQNQTRYNILENYFTNTLPTLKYKNKHRIINAVKIINVEMEEAQKEFSKLFQSNDYQK